MAVVIRWATLDQLEALRALMARSIDHLQNDVLTPQQVAASRSVMGLDTQLIVDGTYAVAEDDGAVIGCGGWSRRSTLYGGDHSVALRDPQLLNPATDAARIRAMYTDPAHTRRGIGRLILSHCEAAAANQGFRRVELMSTLSGQPLYAACGYTPISQENAVVDGVTVPLIRMGKALAPA